MAVPIQKPSKASAIVDRPEVTPERTDATHNGVGKILVVGSDPYPLEPEYCPVEYLPKARAVTSPGLRTWSIVNWLHKQGYNVTLAILRHNCVVPTKPYKFPIVQFENLPYNQFSTIIAQTGHTTIHSMLQMYRGNLILDCWVPSQVEFPVAVSVQPDIRSFENIWRTISFSSSKIASYWLYPHERNLGLVLGTVGNSQHISITDMVDVKKFIHVPYCVPVSNTFEWPTKTRQGFLSTHPECKNLTTFCWFGGAYPWFDFNRVAMHFSNMARQDVRLVLKAFNNYPGLTKNINPNDKRVIFDNQWVPQEDKYNWVSDIDYFFILGDISFEGIFANRTRTLDLCSLGCIVVTDKIDLIGQSAAENGLAYLVDKTDDAGVQKTLNWLANNKDVVKAKRDVPAFRAKYDPDVIYKRILPALY